MGCWWDVRADASDLPLLLLRGSTLSVLEEECSKDGELLTSAASPHLPLSVANTLVPPATYVTGHVRIFDTSCGA